MKNEGNHLAKPYKPNALLRWLYQRFFTSIQIDERWSAVVQDASRRGVVVYIMRSLSFLDFLCLDFLVKRFALPTVRFVNDLGLWILEPFEKGERRLRLRRQIPEDVALTQTLRGQASALLFLRRPPSFGHSARQGADLDIDLMQTLVGAQRSMEQPILLVPQTFVWSRLAARRQRSLIDLFLGPRDWPGKLRVMLQFVTNYRNARLRSGEPFDLAEFLNEHPNLSDKEIADRVRYALLRRIERERTMVLGPSKKSPGRVRDEIMRSDRVRKQLEADARQRNKPLAKSEAYARRELRNLCAAQDQNVVALIGRGLHWLWNRIYAGIEVDHAGIERVRQAARKGTIVLLPSHKSHVDYLVMSYVLHVHALSAPLIAAGDNLSFWPLGSLFRRAGAFFIRRSFPKRKLYTSLLDAYMRKLLLEGFAVEFFIEGGRSRTGKLTPPKLGLLSMVVDAARMVRRRPIYLVPVSIGYERVIEQHAYAHELTGGQKSRENITDLLQTPRILRSRYGRLYVQFGQIIDLHAALKEIEPTAEVQGAHAGDPVHPDGVRQAKIERSKPAQRRAFIQRLALRVTHEINQATVVTPTALAAIALLDHRRRGVPHDRLLQRVQGLLALLEPAGATLAPTLKQAEGPDEAISQAIQLFLDAKLIHRHRSEDEPFYTVPADCRLEVEYYKNNALHFFVPHTLICRALLAHEGESVEPETLRARAVEELGTLRHEFGEPDALLGAAFDAALDALVNERILKRDHGGVQPLKATELGFLAELLQAYSESYEVADRALRQWLKPGLTRQQWIRKAMTTGQRMYLSGEIELKEALCRAKLDAALRALKREGHVRFGPKDTLEPVTEEPEPPRSPTDGMRARPAVG